MLRKCYKKQCDERNCGYCVAVKSPCELTCCRVGSVTPKILCVGGGGGLKMYTETPKGDTDRVPQGAKGLLNSFEHQPPE